MNLLGDSVVAPYLDDVCFRSIHDLRNFSGSCVLKCAVFDLRKKRAEAVGFCCCSNNQFRIIVRSGKIAVPLGNVATARRII